jgi:PHD/YefM family antitoxin component YafN of YafNO toxin-antitoxin module
VTTDGQDPIVKTMAAGTFKSKCLAVMDEVQAKHETVVIKKHGKPVAICSSLCLVN